MGNEIPELVQRFASQFEDGARSHRVDQLNKAFDSLALLKESMSTGGNKDPYKNMLGRLSEKLQRDGILPSDVTIDDVNSANKTFKFTESRGVKDAYGKFQSSGTISEQDLINLASDKIPSNKTLATDWLFEKITSHSPSQIDRAFKNLAELKSAGNSDFKPLLHELFTRLESKGLLPNGVEPFSDIRSSGHTFQTTSGHDCIFDPLTGKVHVESNEDVGRRLAKTAEEGFTRNGSFGLNILDSSMRELEIFKKEALANPFQQDTRFYKPILDAFSEQLRSSGRLFDGEKIGDFDLTKHSFRIVDLNGREIGTLSMNGYPYYDSRLKFHTPTEKRTQQLRRQEAHDKCLEEYRQARQEQAAIERSEQEEQARRRQQQAIRDQEAREKAEQERAREAHR